MASENQNQNQKLSVSVSDEVLKGTYSNNIMISHTRSEFLMDCMTVFPPKGIIGARVIVSPGHAKRLLRALQENVRRYETQYGEIPEEAAPPQGMMN